MRPSASNGIRLDDIWICARERWMSRRRFPVCPDSQGLVIGARIRGADAQGWRGQGEGRANRPRDGGRGSTPLPRGSSRAPIVAFGIRNVAGLEAALKEVFPRYHSGGSLRDTESRRPRLRVVRALYQAYFHYVLPLIGVLSADTARPTTYLPRSVANFPSKRSSRKKLENAGFNKVTWTSLSFGVAAIHVGEASHQLDRIQVSLDKHLAIPVGHRSRWRDGARERACGKRVSSYAR